VAGRGDAAVNPDLDDARWEQIAAILPQSRRRGQQPPVPYRTMLEAILSFS
jgi:hypothetical protein